MTEKEQTFKILGWALAISISISGYLLKQTVDKIDAMYTTMNAIDKRMSILEERQKMIIEKYADDYPEKPREVSMGSTRFMVKPDDLKIKEDIIL